MNAGAFKEERDGLWIGGVENDQVAAGDALVDGEGAKNDGTAVGEGARGVGATIVGALRGSGSRSPVIGPAWNASCKSEIGPFDEPAFAELLVLRIGVVLDASRARLIIAAFLSPSKAALAAAIAFG